MYWNPEVIWLCSVEPLWLTLTWDVLKWNDTDGKTAVKRININMRCIEILNFLIVVVRTLEININMRCIEMQAQRILDNPLASD